MALLTVIEIVDRMVSVFYPVLRTRTRIFIRGFGLEWSVKLFWAAVMARSREMKACARVLSPDN
jgi:hypothetical protein